MLFVRSLACTLGVLLYLAEVTYLDYFTDRESPDVSNLTFSQTFLKQYVCWLVHGVHTVLVLCFMYTHG